MNTAHGPTDRRTPSPTLQQLGITHDTLTSGIFLTGATGAGKTSVISILLQAIVNAFLPGVLHCCVKQDEADNAERFVAGTALEDRCLRLTPGKFTFNFVAWVLYYREGGGSPEALAKLFLRLNNLLHKSRSDGEQSFWNNLFYEFMLHASTVASYAFRESVNVEHILNCILGSPATRQEMAHPDYKTSNACYQMLKLAESNLRSKSEAHQLKQASAFFQMRVPGLGDKARTAGVQQCSSLLGPFLRPPFYETVCCEHSSWTPDAPLNQYYTIVDTPVQVYQDAGRLMNNLLAMLTMDDTLRRRSPNTYVVVVRDEYQFLCDPEFDVLAQSVARSQKLCSISAVQNLPLLQSSFGGGAKAEQEMRALIGNFAMKFLLQNVCDTTNRYFSELFGRRRRLFSSFSEQQQTPQPQGLEGSLWGHPGVHHSQSEQLDYSLPPQSFLDLRRGGPDHDYLIDCYQASSGVIYPTTGEAFRGVTFSQR